MVPKCTNHKSQGLSTDSHIACFRPHANNRRGTIETCPRTFRFFVIFYPPLPSTPTPTHRTPTLNILLDITVQDSDIVSGIWMLALSQLPVGPHSLPLLSHRHLGKCSHTFILNDLQAIVAYDSPSERALSQQYWCCELARLVQRSSIISSVQSQSHVRPCLIWALASLCVRWVHAHIFAVFEQIK